MANVKTSIDIVLALAAGATTFYIPVKERCKVVGAKAVFNPSRGSGDTVTLAKGSTDLGEIAVSDLGGSVDKDVMAAAASAKANIIEVDGGIKVTVSAGTASTMGLTIDVDPFCIEQFHTS
jgi:hypothetical protein